MSTPEDFLEALQPEVALAAEEAESLLLLVARQDGRDPGPAVARLHALG